MDTKQAWCNQTIQKWYCDR